jgi:hypothetical protein
MICSLLIVSMLVSCTSAYGIIPYNIFEPWDVLVTPYRSRPTQFMIGYEGAYQVRAFMDDDRDICAPSSESSRGNVLQVWQKQQDGLAALKGVDPLSPIGQVAQHYLWDDDNRTHAIFTPCGTLHMPLNVLCSARFELPRQLTFSLNIPYRVVNLTNVSWQENNPNETFEQILESASVPPFINLLEQLGGMSLFGWHRHGFGDLTARLETYRVFPQQKPWLQMVGVSLRAGVLFPTGLKADPDKLLALGFGWDGGTGLMAGGGLQLGYCHGCVIGIDGELMHLFGNTQERRIKTQQDQTDLLFLTKVCAFKEPGFVQHYTLSAEKVQEQGGWSGKIAYQYTKKSDDEYFLYDDQYDITIVNDAESLQDWTTHSLIFLLGYDAFYRRDWRIIPSFTAFWKLGFNGKRAILADTVGITLSVAF